MSSGTAENHGELIKRGGCVHSQTLVISTSVMPGHSGKQYME